VLQLVDVHSGYGRSEVIHGVSLEVPSDGVAAVMGHNGAGKTTLLRAAVGLLKCKGIESVYLDLLGAATSPERFVQAAVAALPEGLGGRAAARAREAAEAARAAHADREDAEGRAAELAEQLTGTGVTAYSFHPGTIATNFGSQSPLVRFGHLVTRSTFGIPVAEGAAPLVRLAGPAAVGAPSGTYFDRLRANGRTHPQARNAQLGRDLWAASESLVVPA